MNADFEECVQEHNDHTHTVVISWQNHVDDLTQVLPIFKSLQIAINRILSRKSTQNNRNYEILIDFDCDLQKNQQLLDKLSSEVNIITTVKIPRSIPSNSLSITDETANFDSNNICASFPWFPKNISDLDKMQNVLEGESENSEEYSGLKDLAYQKRRIQFADIANNYKHGQLIPKIQYTDEEIKTWGVVFRELHKLHLKYACKEYLENWDKLVKHCGYREDNIPQLQDVSTFLKRTSGFQLRPVAGYLSPRDFLAGLAFRVFHSTQYLRHSSVPFYTQEPDCVHELLGHVPLLVNPEFAQFSQEIGLASLGTSEENIEKISTLYFFTVEFGMCKENEEFKAYGAGLLASAAELKHALSTPEKIFKFDSEIICKQELVIPTFQKAYYYTENIEEAKEKMRTFVNKLKRPFDLRYNPYTQSVEVLTANKIIALLGEIRDDLRFVSKALSKVVKQDDIIDVQCTMSLLMYEINNLLPKLNGI